MNHESLSFNKQSNLSDNSVKIKKITLSSHCSINRCMVFEVLGRKRAYGLRMHYGLSSTIHAHLFIQSIEKKSPR